MPERHPGIVLGFHGCDRSVAEAVVLGKQNLKPSKNRFDWLGHGVYFWEDNARRALVWAQNLATNPRTGGPKIKTPAVVGAVIDLGLCMNLLDARYLELLPRVYETMAATYAKSRREMPKNSRLEGSSDLLLRDLDCAIIQTVHRSREREGQPAFDSVRGVFIEGLPVYEGAGINSLNHIQICVRNQECIHGYFLPRDLSGET
jgi:hypothetical protein